MAQTGRKDIHIIYTLLFGMAVLLFFGLAYPHHLHYQEQYQLFLFDSTYVWDVVRLPGGIADLLGRYCTQFFLFAWVGAAVIALLLTAVQLLTLRVVRRAIVGHASQRDCRGEAVTDTLGSVSYYGLTFVPSFLLWLFLLDENALLGGVWAVLLTLLVSWIFDLLSDGWLRRILLIAAVPILYWMAGPVCVVFFLLQAPSPKRSPWYYVVFVLLALMPVLLANDVPVPAGRLWTGVHYHRYPAVFPAWLWLAVLSIVVLALLGWARRRSVGSGGWARRRSVGSGGWARRRSVGSGGFLFVLVVVGMGTLVWKNVNVKAEKVMQYDFMARHQQWNRILETVNAEKPNNQIGVTVQNLALAMHGRLADHLFDYNQNGIAGLLPDVQSDATSPLPTAEAFYQLGMINVAQRTVFEAQEAILDFQKSGRCYKRLAQTNLINGRYEVARKYLMALQKTLFYSDWANETLLLLGNEEAIARHPEYGHLRQWAYKEDLTSGRASSRSAISSELDGSRLTGDFYFSDHVTPEMLESLFLGNTDNSLAYQYLVAYYMLTGDREGYAKLLRYTSKTKK